LKSTHSVRAACSLARIIETRRALGDHAFLVRLLRLDELAFTKLGDLLAVVECAELNFTVPNGTFAARCSCFAIYRLWAGSGDISKHCSIARRETLTVGTSFAPWEFG
jgi:hypothetical protein